MGKTEGELIIWCCSKLHTSWIKTRDVQGKLAFRVKECVVIVCFRPLAVSFGRHKLPSTARATIYGSKRKKEKAFEWMRLIRFKKRVPRDKAKCYGIFWAHYHLCSSLVKSNQSRCGGEGTEQLAAHYSLLLMSIFTSLSLLVVCSFVSLFFISKVVQSFFLKTTFQTSLHLKVSLINLHMFACTWCR